MDVVTHEAADGFLGAAGAWLEAEEARNNLILGLAANIAAGRQAMTGPPAMMTGSAGGRPEAALLMTVPPRYALVYAPLGGERPAEMAEVLLSAGHEPRGCIGPVETAEAFARAWERRTGRRATLKTAQRIYELRKVVPPTSVSGRLRPATRDDLDVATEWRGAFEREAMGHGDAAGARAAAERSIDAGQLFLWECRGEPTSQAVATRPTRHGICIGAVYTPPARRGRGFASACVAAVSRLQLDAGRRFCALYTDLANPTSNHIYQQIGYAPVADSSHYRFEDPAEPQEGSA